VRLHVEPGVYRVSVTDTDLIAAPQSIELVSGTTQTVRTRVDIGRSRKLVMNGDGKHKLGREALHLLVRDAAGAIVVQSDITDLYPDLRGFRYWYCDRVFAFGRYQVEAHTDSGLRYRARFEVSDNLDDPTRIDVPFVGQ
jgi:hypothetical protein